MFFRQLYWDTESLDLPFLYVSYKKIHTIFNSCDLLFSTCCCSVAKLWPLCNLMDYSTLDFPVLYCLPEFAETHVHWVSDTIQLSHPLSPSSPPALSLYQHQGLFQWTDSAIGGQSIGASASASTSVLPMNI